jgi:hypothetical protein
MVARTVNEAIALNHQATDEFVRGNDGPLAELYSRADDATLGDPFGPFVRGWAGIRDAMRHAAANYRDGRAEF